MKKMIVTIIILFIIFISMIIYRNSAKEAEVKVEEVNKIESYIEKIYGWKEITNEALPEFNDINSADEKWIWAIIRENLHEFDIQYDMIENMAKELYGTGFNKEFPKEGNEFLSYDNETKKYKTSEITLDAISDSYLLNKIEKIKDGYIVQIVEYLVDYTNAEEEKVTIQNLNGDKIYELTEEEATDGNVKKIVRENLDRFTKKKITLEKQGENIVIKKVEKEN